MLASQLVSCSLGSAIASELLTMREEAGDLGQRKEAAPSSQLMSFKFNPGSAKAKELLTTASGLDGDMGKLTLSPQPISSRS